MWSTCCTICVTKREAHSECSTAPAIMHLVHLISTFFEKNLQGDIVAVYNSNGKKICTYTYDAWGNCTTTRASGITSLESQIASSYNPFRYRGYYYDTQTGFYYLQSRYYNPEWGRFLNADACLYSSISESIPTPPAVLTVSDIRRPPMRIKPIHQGINGMIS